MMRRSFNSESGYALSAAAREAAIVELLEDVNPSNSHAFETFFRLNGDTSNEAALDVMRDSLDVSGGKSGVKLKGLGEMLDDNTKARDGSKSSNVSAVARSEHEVFELKTPTQDLPRIGNNMEDIEICMQAVYVALLEAGVPETDLNHVMRVGNDPREMVGELYDIAQDNNIPLDGYISDIDQSLVDWQMANNIKNVVPAIGTVEAKPELMASNDLDYDLPVPPPMRMM